METETFDLSDLARRLENLIRLGTLEEVDIADRVKVRYAETDRGEPVLTGGLPWIAQRAGEDRTWWPPTVGEQVVLLSPSGELAQAVALPSIYRRQHPAPDNDPATQVTAYRDQAETRYNSQTHVHTQTYPDGCVVEYDAGNHHLNVGLPSGGTAQLVADGGVTVKGDVAVTGKITATENMESDQDVIDKTSSMQAMRDQYNPHSHKPSGPSPQMT